MDASTAYAATRDRVEHYFDRTATRTWERLTSDAPVSRVRQTVREGRDRMRDIMLSRLPADLSGVRVLDAGCGAGQMSRILAERGAEVTGIDISPALISIAEERLPESLRPRVRFRAGDMLSPAHGPFDFTVAMDSLIYYSEPDITDAVARLAESSSEAVVFTVAPRTAFLMAFWGVGKLFPRADRSPVMVPHAHRRLDARLPGHVVQVERVARGFYISDCLEYRA